jgi:RNA polymerase sigma-70 factor (ECF subfamily)
LATRLTDVRAFPRSGVDLGDDKALVLAFQSGDIDAYSDIFVKYRALSAQICYRILQDREEADEAVQETMLRVYRGLGTFNGRYQLQAWVARIATNVALDMVRARSRRPQRDPVTHDISEDTRLAVAPTEDASEAVERVLDQEEIRSILSSIPDHHREALVLREFEGRSHEEIAEALGLSPKQAKALIHRAKKSFRRAWDQGNERRGVATLAPIFLLAPTRMPGFLRRILQPAHDVVASATATVQQAAVQVTAAPAVTSSAVSMADKVTATAITVIVAGTVSVGAVAIRDMQKPSKPTPVTASPAPVPVTPAVILTPTVTKPVVKPHHKPDSQTQGEEVPTGTVPVEAPTESPAPTEPSPTPGSESPPPPPPAPDWSASFSSTAALGAVSLSQLRPEMTSGTADRDLIFSETLTGPRVAPDGTHLGSVYLEYWGWAQPTRGEASLRLYIDGPGGPSDRYVYEIVGSLQSTVQESDGTWTYIFSGPYAITGAPASVSAEQSPESVPHDGAFQLTLRFWQDGTTLFQAAFDLNES